MISAGRIFFGAAFLAALFLFTGCATSRFEWSPGYPGQISSSGQAVKANLEGMNSGVFVFYFLPLWSGQETRPNRGEFYTFENHVRPKHLRRMFDSMKRHLDGDTVEDFVYEEHSTGWWSLWIFWKRSVRGRAVLTESGGR